MCHVEQPLVIFLFFCEFIHSKFLEIHGVVSQLTVWLFVMTEFIFGLVLILFSGEKKPRFLTISCFVASSGFRLFIFTCCSFRCGGTLTCDLAWGCQFENLHLQWWQSRDKTRRCVCVFLHVFICVDLIPCGCWRECFQSCFPRVRAWVTVFNGIYFIFGASSGRHRSCIFHSEDRFLMKCGGEGCLEEVFDGRS